MKSIIIVLALITGNRGHMLLMYPPALRYQGNPNVPFVDIDYNIKSPLQSDGSDFPCKGYQSDLGSELGASVATWVAGDSYNFTLLGSISHNGGSCQVALSYDQGKSFTVIHSYIGGCPVVSPPGGTFEFQVPSDAPPSAALFAWTWFNEVGNREMYMNCASVAIINNASARKRTPNIAFSARPSIFIANLQNGCNTIPGADVSFPNPGPDITNISAYSSSVAGTCQPVGGI